MKDSYSRHAEDRFIHANFFSKRTKPGFYVDLGAGDGVQNNNTLAFQKMGWRGILQETPDLLEELVENRHSAGTMFSDIYVGTEKGKLNELFKSAKITTIDLFCINKGNVINILKHMNWNIPVGVWCINFDKHKDDKKEAADLLKKYGYTFYVNYHGSEIWTGTDLENFNGETVIEKSNTKVSTKTTAMRILVLFALTELVLQVGK